MVYSVSPMANLRYGLLGEPENFGGLLDPSQMNAASNAGLMNFGASLLAASGPSREPTSLGQALGNATMQGRAAQQAYGNQSLQQKIMLAQLEQMQRGKKGELVAVMTPDGPKYVHADDAVNQTPFSMASQGLGSEFLQRYNAYVTQEKAAGRAPVSMLEYARLFTDATTQQSGTVNEVAGVPTLTTTKGPEFGATRALTTLPQQAQGKSTVAAAEASATTTAKGEAEKTLDAPINIRRAEQQIAGVDSVLKTVDTAIERTGAFTAGPAGTVLSNVPGTSAKDLASDLLTIKANLGFDRIQAMRDSSPTGGALGQVAVQELAALQASVASLDNEQSPKQLERNLRKVKQHYENWKDTIEEWKEQNQARVGQHPEARKRVRVDAQGNVIGN
jgi:hypothetical protein